MCLCDFANDDGGNCWPSIATIARKTSKSERTVQGAIKWLADNGFLALHEVPGKSHRFNLNPRKICAPAESAPPQKTSKTPAESAPYPLGTTSNGLAEAKPIRAYRRKGWPSFPDWLPVEAWNGFIEMRDRQGKMPTPRAVSLLLGKLSDFRAKGHDPGKVLDNSTLSNWLGLFEPKDDRNDRPPNFSRTAKPDPLLAMRAIARAQIEAEDSGGYPGDGFGAGPTLRALGSG